MLYVSPALAQVVPPQLTQETVGVWPEGEPATDDVKVLVVLTVNREGLVTDAQVTSSPSPAFDAPALAAARQWIFTPATKDGKPVPAKLKAQILFPRPALPEPPPPPPVPPPVTPPVTPPATPPGAQPGGKPEQPGTSASNSDPYAGDATPPGNSTPPPPVPGTIDVRVVGEGPPRSASAVVVDKAAIQAAPRKNAGEILLSVPGVFVAQQGGQGQANHIFFRGFDADTGQDLEIWAGGAPVNEVSNLRGQGYADMNFIMPEIVHAVRATPGTYDPRQGDFAVAGSMEFELGYDEPGFTGGATMGTYGERRYFLGYHPELASEQTFAAFETQQTDGFGPGRAAQRTTLAAQSSYDILSGVNARVLGIFYASHFNSPGVVRLEDIENGTLDRFASYDPKQGGDSGRTQVVMELSSVSEAAPNGVSSNWSIAPFFVLRQLRLRNNYTGFLVDKQNGDTLQQINETTTIGARGHYRRPFPLFSPRDAIEIGVVARNDWVDQEQIRISGVNDFTTGKLVDASIRAMNVGGYVDLATKPISRVAVRGGIRIDGLSYAVQDRYGSIGTEYEGETGGARAALGAHIGKKATVDVQIWRGLHGLVSYGDGFRSPQARSLSDGEKTPFTEVTSYEAGFRYAEGAELQANLAGFYTRLSQDLAFDVITTANQRTPPTQRVGFSAEIMSRPLQDFVLNSSVTYTRASFTEGDQDRAKGDLLPYVPELISRSDIAYKRAVWRALDRDLVASVGSGLTLMALRPLPFSEFGHDIFLTDASAGLRWKELEVRAEMFNVLGVDWYADEFVYASNFTQGSSPALVPLRHVSVGSPRTFFVTVLLHL